MTIDFDKLAEAFEAGSRFLDEAETLLLSSAVETVVLEKNAGKLEEFGEMDEVKIVELGARVADEVIRRSS
jgi:hypothetical protein